MMTSLDALLAQKRKESDDPVAQHYIDLALCALEERKCNTQMRRASPCGSVPVPAQGHALVYYYQGLRISDRQLADC